MARALYSYKNLSPFLAHSDLPIALNCRLFGTNMIINVSIQMPMRPKPKQGGP